MKKQTKQPQLKTENQLMINNEPIERFVKKIGWVEIDGWLCDPAHVKGFRQEQERMTKVRCSNPRCEDRKYDGTWTDPGANNEKGLGTCLWCNKPNELDPDGSAIS